MAEFKDLVGVTLASVTGAKGADEIVFVADDGRSWKQWHSQDCCESVSVEDICGDINDLIGYPIVMAEESSCKDETPEGMTPPEYSDDSWTWTFYRIATVRGTVVIRWYGDSSGYYSEDVDFDEIKP